MVNTRVRRKKINSFTTRRVNCTDWLLYETLTDLLLTELSLDQEIVTAADFTNFDKKTLKCFKKIELFLQESSEIGALSLADFSLNGDLLGAFVLKLILLH